MKILKFNAAFKFKEVLLTLVKEPVIVKDRSLGDLYLNIHDMNKTTLKELLAEICRTESSNSCAKCPIYILYNNGNLPMDCYKQPHIMLRLLHDKITCPEPEKPSTETLSLL